MFEPLQGSESRRVQVEEQGATRVRELAVRMEIVFESLEASSRDSIAPFVSLGRQYVRIRD